jgi:hypothetical protein
MMEVELQQLVGGAAADDLVTVRNVALDIVPIVPYSQRNFIVFYGDVAKGCLDGARDIDRRLLIADAATAIGVGKVPQCSGPSSPE